MLRSTSPSRPEANVVSRPGIFESDWPPPPPPPEEPPTVVVDANGNVHHAQGPAFQWTPTTGSKDIRNDWSSSLALSSSAIESEWAAYSSITAVPSAHTNQHRLPSRFRPAPLIPVADWDPKLATGNHVNGTDSSGKISEQGLCEKRGIDPPPPPAQQNGHVNGTRTSEHQCTSTPGLVAGQNGSAVFNNTNTVANGAIGNGNNSKGKGRPTARSQAYRSSPAPPASLSSSSTSFTPMYPLPNRPDRPPPPPHRYPQHHHQRQRVLLVLPASLREATADMAYLMQLARQTYNDPSLSATDLDIQYAWLAPPQSTDSPSAPDAPPPGKEKERAAVVKVTSDPANHRIRLPYLLPHLSDASIAQTVLAHLPANIPLASYSITPPTPVKRAPHMLAKSIVLGFQTAFQVKSAYAWLRDKCPPALNALLIPAPALAGGAKGPKPDVHWLTPRPRSLTPKHPPPAPVPVDSPTPLPAVTLTNIDATAHKADVLDVLFGDQPADLRPKRVERLVMPPTDPPTLALRFAFDTKDKVARFVRAVTRGVGEGEFMEVTAPGCEIKVVKVERCEEEETAKENENEKEKESASEQDEKEVEEARDEHVEHNDLMQELREEEAEQELHAAMVAPVREHGQERRGRMGTGGTWVGREGGVV